MKAEQALPKVIPYLLERAADLCPRRLRLDFQGQQGDQGEFLRGRIRDAVVEDARASHAEMGPPNAASFHVRPDLLPEEQAIQQRVIGSYLTLFAAERVQAIDHDDYRKRTPRRGVEVGGWIDLACEREDGAAEYRQFELWGRPLRSDPATNMSLLLALLRLSRWVGERSIHVKVADLVHGELVAEVIDMPARRDEFVAVYEERLQVIEARTRRPEAVPGDHCTACPFVPGCPAFA